MYALKCRRSPSPEPSRRFVGRAAYGTQQSVQVRNALGRRSLQPKLSVGSANDRFEREANLVADQVMRMPDRDTMAVAAGGRVAQPTVPQLRGSASQSVRVRSILRGIATQANVVGGPDDVYERDAERATDQAMSMSVETSVQVSPVPHRDGGQLQRLCVESEEGLQRQPLEEPDEELPTKRLAGARSQPAFKGDLSARIRSLRDGGEPLPKSVRAFFEPRFGRDLSTVRVHTGVAAVRSAGDLGARAYTVGRHIAFSAGSYAPATPAGRRLLAHELVHVAQQATIPQAPGLQAYRPDPIPDQPTAADIHFGLSASVIALREILNTQDRRTQEYQAALRDWPNDQQIWPHLRTRDARLAFIRSLLHTDLTNCRPYGAGTTVRGNQCTTFARNQETFRHFCTGYATQLHIRLRDQPEPPGPDQIERLRSEARIYYQAVEPKFRIPIFIAHSTHHAFNAILVDRDPSNIESYLFVEPQSDTLFPPTSAMFRQHADYFGLGMLRVSEFADVGEPGQPEGITRHCFIRDDVFGRIVDADLTDEECRLVDDFVSAIFIFDYPRAIYQRRVPNPGTYENYARRELAEICDISEDYLVRVGAYFIGRRFRRSPNGPEEVLEIDTLLAIAGRESLRERLRESFLDVLPRRLPRNRRAPPPEPRTPPGTESV